VLADHRQRTSVVAELATLAEQLEHLPAAPALTEVRRLEAFLRDEGPDREDVLDLQRSLWGLHAVLDLHLLLEDELYSGLTTSASTPGS
jgi:hypothetical protein